jgi:hypothetical protein
MNEIEVEKINNLYKRVDELEKENADLKSEVIAKLDVLIDATLEPISKEKSTATKTK